MLVQQANLTHWSGLLAIVVPNLFLYAKQTIRKLQKNLYTQSDKKPDTSPTNSTG